MCYDTGIILANLSRMRMYIFKIQLGKKEEESMLEENQQKSVTGENWWQKGVVSSEEDFRVKLHGVCPPVVRKFCGRNCDRPDQEINCLAFRRAIIFGVQTAA